VVQPAGPASRFSPACAAAVAAAQLAFRPVSRRQPLAPPPPAPTVADRWGPPVIPFVEPWPRRTRLCRAPPSSPTARAGSLGPHAKEATPGLFKDAPPTPETLAPTAAVDFPPSPLFRRREAAQELRQEVSFAPVSLVVEFVH
jgi:hypothetical protein